MILPPCKHTDIANSELAEREQDLFVRAVSVIRAFEPCRNAVVNVICCTNIRFKTIIVENIAETESLEYLYKRMNQAIETIFATDQYRLNTYINLYLVRNGSTAGEKDVDYNDNYS